MFAQRTWAENDLFRLLSAASTNNGGASPGFHVESAGSEVFMRLCLTKAAHVALIGALGKKSQLIRPMYVGANMHGVRVLMVERGLVSAESLQTQPGLDRHFLLPG